MQTVRMSATAAGPITRQGAVCVRGPITASERRVMRRTRCAHPPRSDGLRAGLVVVGRDSSKPTQYPLGARPHLVARVVSQPRSYASRLGLVTCVSLHRTSMRRGVVGVVALVWLAGACSTSRPFKIVNSTSETVALAGCAQEPHLDRTIPPHGEFTFSEDVGQRTLSDDPGFACLLKTTQGQLLCLRLPTDQAAKTRFDVTEAKPTDSFSTCVAHSDPHL